MPQAQLTCLHCGKEPGAVNAKLCTDPPLVDQKLTGQVTHEWECEHCHKTNYFKIPWEPLYDKFLAHH